MNRYFADISNNNTQHMNFEAYKKSGHVLLGHKATEGVDFVDSYHAERCERAHAKAKLHVLHYHFGHVSQSPDAQAEHFYNTIRGHFAKHDIACLDIEGGGMDGHGARTTAMWTNQFARHFTTISGKHLVGYCNEALLRELVRAGVSIATNRWWIAAYGSKKPSIGSIRTWAWQFTDGDIGPQPHALEGIGRGDVSLLNVATYMRLRSTRP